jgi:histidyl-tRNA synthetase
LEAANKFGARHTIILGQKEVTDGTIIIRDMESGVQEVVDYGKIAKELQKKLEKV